MGSLLLLAADTAARVMMAPNVLPVAVLTSFVGAPIFLYLLVRGYRR
jgi:iron complex transport system permease protein